MIEKKRRKFRKERSKGNFKIEERKREIGKEGERNWIENERDRMME